MASVWRKGRLKKLKIRRKVSGLVHYSGVMAGGWGSDQRYALLATLFPSAVTWAFLGFQRLSSGDRDSKPKLRERQCHACYENSKERRKFWGS